MNHDRQNKERTKNPHSIPLRSDAQPIWTHRTRRKIDRQKNAVVVVVVATATNLARSNWIGWEMTWGLEKRPRDGAIIATRRPLGDESLWPDCSLGRCEDFIRTLKNEETEVGRGEGDGASEGPCVLLGNGRLFSIGPAPHWPRSPSKGHHRTDGRERIEKVLSLSLSLPHSIGYRPNGFSSPSLFI